MSAETPAYVAFCQTCNDVTACTVDDGSDPKGVAKFLAPIIRRGDRVERKTDDLTALVDELMDETRDATRSTYESGYSRAQMMRDVKLRDDARTALLSRLASLVEERDAAIECKNAQIDESLKLAASLTGGARNVERFSLDIQDGRPFMVPSAEGQWVRWRDTVTKPTGLRASSDTKRLDWLESKNAQVRGDAPILPPSCGYSVRRYIDGHIVSERTPQSAGHLDNDKRIG